MSGELRNTNSADEGLLALVMLLRFHGIGADPEQIRHRFGACAFGIPEMLRCARELGLKAQSRATTWKRLISTPLPAIVGLRDGGFLVLGKIARDYATTNRGCKYPGSWTQIGPRASTHGPNGGGG